MHKTRRYGAALLAAVSLISGSATLVLNGCGGNNAPNRAMVPTGTGRAQLTVRWPERTRLVPFASESVRVRILRDNTLLGERLLTRPTDGGLATAIFEKLPTGDVQVEAVAFPAADGSGVAQAQGVVAAVVIGKQTTTVRLTLGSTIDRVELVPATTTLTVGQTATLSLTARNAAGDVVLIAPAKVDWTTSSASASVLSGTVTALAPGSATITATETESGKTATAIVTVNPAPTPTPPVDPAPLYDGFDYAPGTAVTGLNGGRGFIGGWTTSGSGSSSTVVSGSLSFGNLATSGNAIRMASFSPGSHDRNYGPLPTTPGTVRYWSMLMRPESVTGGFPGPYFGYAIYDRFIGKSSDQTPLGIERGGGGGPFASTGITPQANATYFFVIRVTYGQTSDTYDYWVNPTPGAMLPVQPSARQSILHDNGPDAGHGFGASVPVIIDELRIGPTWESVSPTTATAGAVKCDPSSGHCYEKIAVAKDTVTFEQIRDAAAARTYNGRAGHLATITSQAEVDFLRSVMDLTSLKIGAYQDRKAPDYSEPGGGWRWVTGEPWIFTYWQGGEPNNVGGGEDYIGLASDGRWNDSYPGDLQGYLVEYEP